jgi:hypothetical protein
MKSTGGVLGAAQATGDFLLSPFRGNPTIRGNFANGERIRRGPVEGRAQQNEQQNEQRNPEVVERGVITPDGPAGSEIGPGTASPELTAEQQATRAANAQIDANLARIEKGLAPSTSTFGGSGQAPGTGFYRSNSTEKVTRFNRPFEFNKSKKVQRQSGGGASTPSYRVDREGALQGRPGAIHPLNFAAPTALAASNRLQRNQDEANNPNSLTAGEARMQTAREAAERLRLDTARADTNRQKGFVSAFKPVEEGLLSDNQAVVDRATDTMLTMASGGENPIAVGRAAQTAFSQLQAQNANTFGAGIWNQLSRAFGSSLNADKVDLNQLQNIDFRPDGNIIYTDPESGGVRPIGHRDHFSDPRLARILRSLIAQEKQKKGSR